MYCEGRPIARLIPDADDFPWHFFRLRTLPAYNRYAHIFALEYSLCQYDYTDLADSPRYMAYYKIVRFLKHHVYIIQFIDQTIMIWHDFICHSEGDSFWVKYGTQYQHYPRQFSNPEHLQELRFSSFTRRYILFWTRRREPFNPPPLSTNTKSTICFGLVNQNLSWTWCFTFLLPTAYFILGAFAK